LLRWAWERTWMWNLYLYLATFPACAVHENGGYYFQLPIPYSSNTIYIKLYCMNDLLPSSFYSLYAWKTLSCFTSLHMAAPTTSKLSCRWDTSVKPQGCERLLSHNDCCRFKGSLPIPNDTLKPPNHPLHPDETLNHSVWL
jgi:hypothetical protein